MGKSVISNKDLKSLLEEKHRTYDHINFIEDDPVSIPHKFQLKQDIEISGLFAATLAWGQRKTIINKCTELLGLMDNSPYDFVLHHSTNDIKRLSDFKHRTFNSEDLLLFTSFLQRWYNQNDSLESAFIGTSTKERLTNFHTNVFEGLDQSRTKKHVAAPARKSACKRLNMYLRWMVRTGSEVDFGIWNNIPTSDLHCPLDVHVERVAKNLGLLKRKQSDWLAVEELTTNLKKFDSNDPGKYDYALFGLGLEEKYGYSIEE